MLIHEPSMFIAETYAALAGPGQPFEMVEAALFEHRVVADCAVLEVSHVASGEEVRLPTHIWFRSEPLPRNPQGTALKRQFREEPVL